METSGERIDFGIVEDVRIGLRAELDNRSISFPELMKLEVGSVLQLSRPTGENVDLYAGEILIGNGEILVIDANLAVRVAGLRDKMARNGSEPETNKDSL
jgi:flagellar motor switch/type III secretory pathway protein FliN